MNSTPARRLLVFRTAVAAEEQQGRVGLLIIGDRAGDGVQMPRA